MLPSGPLPSVISHTTSASAVKLVHLGAVCPRRFAKGGPASEVRPPAQRRALSSTATRAALLFFLSRQTHFGLWRDSGTVTTKLPPLSPKATSACALPRPRASTISCSEDPIGRPRCRSRQLDPTPRTLSPRVYSRDPSGRNRPVGLPPAPDSVSRRRGLPRDHQVLQRGWYHR